ncbi:MAG: ABC transporter substrate-binding protein [Bacillota bacterium]|jgi:ABC-type Fe3+-hydroxamate transport system substrate-binding protein
MRKVLLLLVLVIVALATTAAIAVNYQRPIRTITVEDDSGTLLVYFRQPERLVVLDASAGRLLRQIGLEARVVGVSEEAAELFPDAELLGPVGQADPLSIVALRPDLVLMGRESLQLSQRLRSGGVNVWLSAPASVEQLLSGIVRLGKLLDREYSAHQLAEQLENQLFGWRQNNAVGGTTRALLWLDEQLTTAGSGTMESDLLILAGGVNVVETSGYAPLSLQEGLLLAPQVIFAPPTLIQQLSQLIQQTEALGQPPSPDQSPPPRLITLPQDLAQVNWETALTRVDWIGHQLSTDFR